MEKEDTKFEDLTVNELKAVAEAFAVDLGDKKKKADIIDEIEALGVTFETYKAQLAPDDDEDETLELAALDETPLDAEPEPAPVEDEEELVLLKMTRKNYTYEVRGYRFSQDNPYALVSEEDADYLLDKGFRIAGPKELREFYAL